jgi:O-methyltransferase domain/Dimerisation domain
MPKKTSPHAKMLNLVIGHWVSRLVQVAAQLNIADLLKAGPRTAEELAKAAHVRAPQLYRVLRALASVGVFAETKNGRFKLTPLAATLQTRVPGSMRTAALMLNSDWQWDAWQKLLDGVASDDVPFVKAHGMSVFEYLEKHPDDLAAFHDSATGLTNPAIAAAYNFSKFHTLVDVGGSHGALLSTILKAHPSLKGVLFDQPSVIAGAKKGRHLAEAGIAGRCKFESGSFFVSVPVGADAYIMKYILHDWDDERCVKILSNCRSAMNKNGRVLVVDSVVPPGNEPGYVKLLDIEMLVIGGRERTKADFSSIFRKSGLKLTRVVTTKSQLSIVEGVRA